MAVFVIQLRRQENSQPWGFRLKGGVDQGLPLHVEQVQAKGRAASSGVVVGDMILAICGQSTYNMTHQQVKTEMLRAGNELDITVQRDPSIAAQQPPPVQAAPQMARGRQEDEPRVVIDEQPICKLGGPTYKQVKPKTYQVLEDQLHQPEVEAPAAVDHGAAAKPASIFDRNRNDRSQYLKATGCTIQKAYGE